MTAYALLRWREARFPARSTRASRELAAAWYGCSRRSWEHWEQGTRPVPRPLVQRIAAEEQP